MQLYSFWEKTQKYIDVRYQPCQQSKIRWKITEEKILVGGTDVGLTNSPSWSTLSNRLVHLGMIWTNTGESLIRAFNALDSYQSRDRPLEPFQNSYS